MTSGPPPATHSEPSPNTPAYPEEVRIVEAEGRRFVLVGTAHVSQESIELVRAVIEHERPDTVCVELDQRRYEALSQRKRWESLDLREVIRNRQLAVKAAQEHGIEVALCDRDVRITLRRAWGALSLWKKSLMLSGALATVFETPQIDEEELRRLRKQDALRRGKRWSRWSAPGISRAWPRR
jgi:pheromone shutdown protein TraB